MSVTLLDCVADCFQGSGNSEGMHCLGAVSGADSASPSGMGGRGGVMSVVRALGVLVCEGRIQGPPRGYKEGPHCAAPLQPSANDHKCDKDNYLCGRYLVLVREIADRITIGSSLCVEVLMCSDCPCGLARATCKDPVSLVSSNGISQWQHPSDVLLEYWAVSVVPCKSPEMMNSQGLYQAVRSRLHFSQVAAWWSRSNGTKPNYVTTRVVPYNEDNIRKFRESPIEHTFPLAGTGDGNSIKVTVWALPRMEEVPTLNCPLHPLKDSEEECAARALTPTKNGPVPSSSHTPEALVLPVLVDDRLQTPCDKPGKHHCHCEDEEGSPPSPSIRPNGERKRRRSLPCGPSETGSSATPFGSSSALPSVIESTSPNFSDFPQTPNYPRYPEPQIYSPRTHRTNDSERSQRSETIVNFENRSYLSTGSLEMNFRSQVSLDEREPENDEKRYKPSSDALENFENSEKNANVETTTTTEDFSLENSNGNFDDGYSEKLENFDAFACSDSPKIHGESNEKIVRRSNDSSQKFAKLSNETNVVVNPLAEKNLFHEPNPGPSSYVVESRKNVVPTSSLCTVHQNYSRASRTSSNPGKTRKIVDPTKNDVEKNSFATGKDITHLMSKLAFPKEKTNSSSSKIRDDGGIFDWFAKVPSRVMTVPSIVGNDEKTKIIDKKIAPETKTSDVKLKNCNLELSQREFDEVLAVLRSRTPSGRKRVSVKNLRRRERGERFNDDGAKISDPDYDQTCVCPIHRELRRDNGQSCCCKYCKKIDKFGTMNESPIYRCEMETSFVDRRSTEILEDGTTKIVGKTVERLQNVSNKADVLLGAILRTRERRGLTDISNGARPRIVAPENHENPSDDVTPSNSRKIDGDDDKSLPSVLNKRLNRFKQLFKKESDNRQSTTTEIRSSPSFTDYITNETRKIQNYGRKNFDDQHFDAKKFREIGIERKIDGINFSELPTTSTEICETSFDDPKRRGIVENVDGISETYFDARENCFKQTVGSSSMENVSTMVRTSRGINGDVVIDVDDDETCEKGVPSAIEQERFRRSLENAASMVFHSRTGLPLTSSPAPLRRGSCCFDYDSSLISVSSKRSALFELNTPPSPGAVSLEETDREIENSGEGEETPKRTSTARSRPQSHALLGSFEESALNGRLEPVSTVHGFTAELGASGTFCPKHRKLPVTVFFYTLGDNDKVSTPYLAHINLGKKGYQVPRSGTIQVTLLNPLGTVVKMFVVLYDLSDMPPRSHTFLRQRTLRDKTLRYLVHLRFMSGKSGRIYLHTDIRMIICRKSDVDTASDFGSEPPKELRSYIHGPTNPKFSPRC